jgi:hypothetical protein
MMAALCMALVTAPSPADPTGSTVAQDGRQPNFVTSDRCIACHSDMVDARGETLSIGHTWRASLMAQSAKDPYWLAAVRREMEDRPHLQATIEDTCSVCHMPMFRTRAVANGRSGEILRYLEGGFSPEEWRLGADGVSCTVCHQIAADNLGEHASFDGGYVIEPSLPEEGTVYGPYDVGPGLQRVMRSASAMLPGQGAHIQSSEFCATCHTLFTPAIDGQGRVIGDFAEQVPYLEWKHSAYEGTESCQDCHMPEVEASVPIASVLGEPRENVSRHAFRGGNVFMLRLFDRYRDELGVTTPELDLAQAADDTLAHLQSHAARVEITGVSVSGSEALIDLRVSNLAGHKLPTAYPSRRAWLHVTVRDESGREIFESGALDPDGSIVGNDNDADPKTYEPHYEEISGCDQVQIYEPVIHDYKNEVTTSLLSGATYAKDNRLLPRGFDKSTADEAVSVRGAASEDDDFEEGGDVIRYRVSLPDGVDSVRVAAELLYQTIGYRWARNLQAYESHETDRFVGFFNENAGMSAVLLAEANR